MRLFVFDGQFPLLLVEQCKEAGHSTASLNHCYMIASFRQQLGSKLAAHWQHGHVPAASWFQVIVSERPFIMDPTLP